jgi:hypothetical protein
MASPSCWVFSIAIATDLCPIQNGFDSSAQPTGSFGFKIPDRLQRDPANDRQVPSFHARTLIDALGFQVQRLLSAVILPVPRVMAAAGQECLVISSRTIEGFVTTIPVGQRCNHLGPLRPFQAHRIISLPRGNSVARGTRQTRLQVCQHSGLGVPPFRICCSSIRILAAIAAVLHLA